MIKCRHTILIEIIPAFKPGWNFYFKNYIQSGGRNYEKCILPMFKKKDIKNKIECYAWKIFIEIPKKHQHIFDKNA